MPSTRIIVAALLIVAILITPVQAKPNLSDWNNVQNLKLGSNIAVSTKRGELFEGKLKHIDADSLLLLVQVSRSARQAIEVRREDVAQVRKAKRRGLSMALGFGIGLAAGIAFGAISEAQHPGNDDPGLAQLVGALLGAPVGLAVGTGMPLKGKKVYVAP